MLTFVFPQAVITNNTVTEEGERHGVRTYIFAPCIVYGRGEGFGNIISIQTVAIVKAARAMKRVYKVDRDQPTWPVCHVLDNTALYIEILRAILLGGKDLGHGRDGYFLASPGAVAWDDLYTAMAAALARRNVIGDHAVVPANKSILGQIGEALGCAPEFVPVQMGGL
jgi:nucleoside-diphosphate-sugar epimerase